MKPTLRLANLRPTLLLLLPYLLVSCGSNTSTSKVTYTIGGTVQNLAVPGGSVVLQDNGGDTDTLSANGAFTFPTAVASGGAYNVTVQTQPTSPAQNCQVTNGQGTANANVTNIVVNCAHGEWTWVGGSNLTVQPGTYGTPGVAAVGNIPGARSNGVNWKDSSGNLWLFGGDGYDKNSANGFMNDLWKYSISNGEWTWVGGPNTNTNLLKENNGNYGMQGVSATTNVPGARGFDVSWTDSAGNFWLFGGFGNDSNGAQGDMNDLWEYTTSGQWIWIGGPKTNTNLVMENNGNYGMMGMPATSNLPGARDSAFAWTDSSGNLWLFGGFGLDSAGTSGYLNDLWKYTISTNQWTWVGGPKFTNVAQNNGTYGMLSMPAASNIPGARISGAIWTDSSGNFWLLGGFGLDSAGTNGGGYLNDLWKYNVSSGQWTWMSGSKTLTTSANYGTLGTAAAANFPGARWLPVSWTDSSGNLWLFGGIAYDSAGTFADIDDLWEYNTSNNQWAWMGGPKVASQPGTYGTQGKPAPGNVPGSRDSSFSWTDASGNLWLFGGNVSGANGNFNDLWMYLP